MRKPIVVSVATLAISATIALSPEPVSGRQGTCILTSHLLDCPVGKHLAFRAGDFDEWDGGDHDDVCFDQPCCWQTGGDEPCKHPACASLALVREKGKDGASVVNAGAAEVRPVTI